MYGSNERPTDVSKITDVSIEKEKEFFYDLSDAVEQMEHDSRDASLSSNSTIRVYYSTLGELLGMNIT